MNIILWRGPENLGVMGVGSLQEVGQETAEIGNKCSKIMQFFAIERVQRGGSHCGRGWEPEVQGMGSRKFRVPCPPPLFCTNLILIIILLRKH